jgi:hypothetical protein
MANNFNINTKGLPSTDPRTWDNEYEVGDEVVLRSDMRPLLRNIGALEDTIFKIVNVEVTNQIKNPQNPYGKAYTLENGGIWGGKDLELAINQSVATPSPSVVQPSTSTNNGLSVYESNLLSALNVSKSVQAILPKDLVDSAYVIYEMQKFYSTLPEGQMKDNLALAIAEGTRILLMAIKKVELPNVTSQQAPIQQPLPPTPPPPQQPQPPQPPQPPQTPQPPQQPLPPQPPRPPKTPKTPKPQTPQPPQPPQENYTCQELKDAIKGLNSLAKLGDDDAKEEIKRLKEIMKQQNCK